MHLYYSFALAFVTACVGEVVGFEARAPARVEPPLKYHPCGYGCLTALRHPEPGQCMVGSLTGAVASQRVTEARDGGLRLVGNQPVSAMA